MSLAPQRPNFVLIWIGVIMLTFSMTGKWLLTEPVRIHSTYGPTGFVLQDNAFLDLPSLEGGMLMENSLSTPASQGNDLQPEVGQPTRKTPLDVWNLADGVFSHEKEFLPGNLAEILTPTSTLEEAALVKEATSLIRPNGTQPEVLDVHHSLRPTIAVPASSHKTAKAKRADSGQWNSTWQGNRGGRARAAKVGPSKGNGVVVRAQVTPIAQGRLLVRFHLKQQNFDPSDLKILALLDRRLDANLLKRATDLLQSLEQVVEDKPGQTREDDTANRTKRLRLQNMKQKLIQHLQQRPGGLELVAELTPAQLDSLMHKLSARNPKFRALMEG